MKKLRSPLLSVLAIYILCFIFRMIEYFMIRTDQTLLGEAIIHKIAGIIILWIAIKMLSTDFEFIGFKRKGIFKNFAFGLLFGYFCVCGRIWGRNPDCSFAGEFPVPSILCQQLCCG